MKNVIAFPMDSRLAVEKNRLQEQLDIANAYNKNLRAEIAVLKEKLEQQASVSEEHRTILSRDIATKYPMIALAARAMFVADPAVASYPISGQITLFLRHTLGVTGVKIAVPAAVKAAVRFPEHLVAQLAETLGDSK